MKKNYLDVSSEFWFQENSSSNIIESIMSDSIWGLSQSLRPPKEGPEGCLGSRKCGQFKGARLGIQSQPTPLNLTLNVCRNIICQVPNNCPFEIKLILSFRFLGVT